MQPKWFDLNSETTLKDQYLSLCKTLHPDAGGDPMDFIEMVEEWDVLMNKAPIDPPKVIFRSRQYRDVDFTRGTPVILLGEDLFGMGKGIRLTVEDIHSGKVETRSIDNIVEGSYADIAGGRVKFAPLPPAEYRGIMGAKIDWIRYEQTV